MDDDTDTAGIVDYAWHHAIISDEVYQDIKTKCNYSAIEVNDDMCDGSMNELFEAYAPIDIYSLYTPVCTGSSSSNKISTRDFPKSFPTYVNSFHLILP